jgi:hypothetical protein
VQPTDTRKSDDVPGAWCFEGPDCTCSERHVLQPPLLDMTQKPRRTVLGTHGVEDAVHALQERVLLGRRPGCRHFGRLGLALEELPPSAATQPLADDADRHGDEPGPRPWMRWRRREVIQNTSWTTSSTSWSSRPSRRAAILATYEAYRRKRVSVDGPAWVW